MILKERVQLRSGVARGGKWRHVLWGAGLVAQQHTLYKHFKRVFKQTIRPKYFFKCVFFW